MPSAAFLREIQGQFLRPRMKLVYHNNGYHTDCTNVIISMSPIRSSDDLSAQYVTVVLENTVDTWEAFRTTHTELTKKVEIFLCIGNPLAYTKPLAYVEGGGGADTITDASNGFLAAGFCGGTVLTISGTANNNKTVMVTDVTAGVMTISTSDDLDNESAINSTLTTETYLRFVGYVESAIISVDQATCTLKLRDRISLLLENKVIAYSDGDMVDIYSNYFSSDGTTRNNGTYVGQIVWSLLTTYGKLDATASTDNTDIDYTSWVSWKHAVGDDDWTIFDIGCVIGGGPSVSSIISAIAKLTVSQIWCGPDGKIKFKSSAQSIGTGQYTLAQTLSATLEVSVNERKTLYYAKYGYMPSVDEWVSDTDGISAVQTYYGPPGEPYTTQIEWEQDREVYHNTITSAHLYSDESLFITGPPIRTWEIELPLFGVLEDVGNEVDLLDYYDDPPYDEMEVHLSEFSFDPMTFIVTLKGYWLWGAGELA